MSAYAQAARGLSQTPQDRPMPGRTDMVQNNAGGYVFKVDLWERLRRFLILGSEGGTYYESERDLTEKNAGAVIEALRADGVKAVEIIAEVSEDGRAPKNDPAIFALALATAPQYADERTRQAAFEAIPRVCRIGTHILQFCSIVDQLRGWGQGLMKGVSAWYEGKDPAALAYQAVKYQNRHGWTHRDALRSAHKTAGSPNGAVYDWISGRKPEVPEDALPPAIQAYERAQRAQSVGEVVRAIEEFGGALPHEAIPTHLKANAEVWEALLAQGMPVGAMIRNLANMTRYGLLTVTSDATKTVVAALTDPEKLAKARIHPVNALRALYAYRAGRPPLRRDALNPYGMRHQPVDAGKKWDPVNSVVDALDEAFYLAFGHVEPYGTRRMIAVDCSGSMTWPESQVGGIPGFYARDAAAAMSLVSLKTGDPTHVTGFSYYGGSRYRGGGSRWGIQEVGVSARQRLDDAINAFAQVPAGGTDCALPMLYAADRGLEVDCFEVYTDNETWAGEVQPVQALQRYRRESGIPARLVVVGMTATDFTIADPTDGGMLDVVGFDTAAPQVIADFGAGAI